MSSNDNTSTLKAVTDSVTGTVQSVVGSITGSTADKAEGEAKQDKASAEHDASKATLKLPGATATTSGVATDHPDRASGAWDQTVGSAKEAIGGVIGSQVCIHPDSYFSLLETQRHLFTTSSYLCAD